MPLLVKAEGQQIVVLNDVWFHLQTQFAGALGLSFAAGLEEVGEADDFGTNETFLEV